MAGLMDFLKADFNRQRPPWMNTQGQGPWGDLTEEQQWALAGGRPELPEFVDRNRMDVEPIFQNRMGLSPQRLGLTGATHVNALPNRPSVSPPFLAPSVDIPPQPPYQMAPPLQELQMYEGRMEDDEPRIISTYKKKKAKKKKTKKKRKYGNRAGDVKGIGRSY